MRTVFGAMGIVVAAAAVGCGGTTSTSDSTYSISHSMENGQRVLVARDSQGTIFSNIAVVKDNGVLKTVIGVNGTEGEAIYRTYYDPASQQQVIEIESPSGAAAWSRSPNGQWDEPADYTRLHQQFAAAEQLWNRELQDWSHSGFLFGVDWSKGQDEFIVTPQSMTACDYACAIVSIVGCAFAGPPIGAIVCGGLALAACATICMAWDCSHQAAPCDQWYDGGGRYCFQCKIPQGCVGNDNPVCWHG